jgi:RNA polymerase sigma factor (sigma-70 family)
MNNDRVLQLLKDGNYEILWYLYKKSIASISKYVKSNSGNTQDAEDILQEALLTFWQKACDPNFRLTSLPTTYIFAIAKNLWLKALEKRKTISNPNNINTTDDFLDNLEDKIITEEKFTIIDKAYKLLGENCKEILKQYYFLKLSMQEIATKLNYANANVAKAKKHQCLSQLRELCNKETNGI